MNAVLKEKVLSVLLREDEVGMHAVGRALVHLHNRQNVEEQYAEETRYRNGRGFRPCHANKGSSMAKWYMSKGFLTAKQRAYWQRPANTSNGKSKPRITIYVGQIMEEAEAKAKGMAA